MGEIIGNQANVNHVFSEVKRGLIIGRRDEKSGQNPFFLMASFGKNQTGTILDPQKLVALSLLSGIIVALSTNLIRKLLR